MSEELVAYLILAAIFGTITVLAIGSQIIRRRIEVRRAKRPAREILKDIGSPLPFENFFVLVPMGRLGSVTVEIRNLKDQVIGTLRYGFKPRIDLDVSGRPYLVIASTHRFTDAKLIDTSSNLATDAEVCRHEGGGLKTSKSRFILPTGVEYHVQAGVRGFVEDSYEIQGPSGPWGVIFRTSEFICASTRAGLEPEVSLFMLGILYRRFH